MNRTVLNRDELPSGSSIRRVSETAAELGLDIEIVKMAESTRTAEDAAAACGCQVGQIIKSLVFENTDTGVITLLLVSGAHNADLDHVASVHGLKLGRCDGRRVRHETGFAIERESVVVLNKIPIDDAKKLFTQSWYQSHTITGWFKNWLRVPALPKLITLKRLESEFYLVPYPPPTNSIRISD